VFQKLVNHNDDLERLVKKGYAIAFDSGYLVVRDIPYLNKDKGLETGAIVAKLVFVDEVKVIQENHQIFFAGSTPHNIDGTPVQNLADRPHQLPLSEVSKDVIVQRSFSNKPKATGKFEDFFEKIESYVNLISGPAMHLHDVDPYTFRTVEVMPDSVSKFHDTLTSKAEITDLVSNFKEDVVAIIGLGGTGAYILDFLVKTAVKEIRAFDFDDFHVHNAFRSPGRVDKEEFSKKKAEIYQQRYDNFRHGLTIKSKFVDASCEDDFNGVTFAFVCVDKGSSRSGIFDLLMSKGIPFIDVGMGLKRKQDSLIGMLRTTYYSSEHAAQVRSKDLAPMSDNPDDIYKTNIQISELNAMNACLAVMKFKQLRGFYQDETPDYHLLFDITDLSIAGEKEL
jgi:hypothetical protein